MTQNPKDFAAQPANAAVLKMLRSKRGATFSKIADARGTEDHTIRAVLSRLRSQAKIKMTKSEDAKRGVGFRTKGGAQ